MEGALVTPQASAGGTLHVVSTPIGNLGDLSPRAVEVLGAVAAVLAEDTRHTRILWERFGLKTPLIAHQPRAAIDAGVRVSPVPGASALLAALVGAGLDATAFTFYGFLPRKGAERASRLAAIAALEHTAVLYEAPGRVGETLEAIGAAGAGSRQAVVARELTKQYEEFRRGTVAELAAYYGANEPRGEVVLLIAGGSAAPLDEDALRARAQQLRAAGRAPREVMQELMTDARVGRNLAYRLAHE